MSLLILLVNSVKYLRVAESLGSVVAAALAAAHGRPLSTDRDAHVRVPWRWHFHHCMRSFVAKKICMMGRDKDRTGLKIPVEGSG